MDIHPAAVHPYPDQIDSIGFRRRCETRDSVPLPVVDGVDGIAGPGGGAHFDRNSGVTVHGNQVDLAIPDPDIGSDQAQTVVGEESSGKSLPKGTQVPFDLPQIFSSECSSSSTFTSLKVST